MAASSSTTWPAATRRPPPMVLGCLTGMLLGLGIDAATLPIESIAALCSAADSFAERTVLHWRLLPMTHGLMLAGASPALLTARPPGACGRRIAIGVRFGCLVAMLLGMALAMPLAPLLAVALGGSAVAGMLLAMSLGMVAAGAALHPLRRWCCWC